VCLKKRLNDNRLRKQALVQQELEREQVERESTEHEEPYRKLVIEQAKARLLQAYAEVLEGYVAPRAVASFRPGSGGVGGATGLRSR
jgi:hypothetical protein